MLFTMRAYNYEILRI